VNVISHLRLILNECRKSLRWVIKLIYPIYLVNMLIKRLLLNPCDLSNERVVGVLGDTIKPFN
jgi:hypothetical protein